MLIKLDEDLPPLVAGALVRSGHEVRRVTGQGWAGLKDDELWPRVCGERVVFVTADKGFGDIRLFPPGSHAGILVLRPERDSVVALRDLLATVVARKPLESFLGTVAVATAHSVRVRRVPL